MLRSTPVLRAVVLASPTVMPAKSGMVTSWPWRRDAQGDGGREQHDDHHRHGGEQPAVVAADPAGERHGRAEDG